MDVQHIMEALEQMGTEQTRKIWRRHGARDPFFGVKVADMKKTLVKQYKKNHEVALALYRTGNSDAMYLAGLISDPQQMTPDLLEEWVQGAYWYLLSEYAVAWTAAESPAGLKQALEWIERGEEHVASAGWATLSSWLGIAPAEAIDLELVDKLLERVETGIHASPNRVRYTMNGFVIALGAYVPERTQAAMDAAERIGKVSVSMGDTACKVPEAVGYIQKIADKGRVGKKKKTAKC